MVSLVAGVTNALTVNSLGSNDQRYADLAVEVRPYVDGSEGVATNAFHILDIHAHIPSVPVSNYTEAAGYKKVSLGHAAEF